MVVMDFLVNFIQTYFLDPIIYDQGYNIYNTTVYGLILVFFAYYLFRFFEWKKIKIDKYFAYAILPFVIFGSSFRVWEDAGLVDHWFFITPGSYIFTFLLLTAAFGLSIIIKNKLKIKRWKTVAASGGILAAISLFGLSIIDFRSVLWILTIFMGWVAVIFFAEWKWNFGKDNATVLSAHMLDASATFVGMGLGYYEQHVLGGYFINTFGPSSFFGVKLAIIPLALYVINKYSESKEQRNYLLLIVAILGLAPGLRSVLRIMMGV